MEVHMRILLCLTVLAAMFAHSAAAAERRCVGTNTTVYADSAYDTYLACAGAADAAGFLAQQGFTVDTVMQVDILDTVFVHSTENPSFRVLGQYDAARNRILVTSIAGQRQMAAKKPIFGIAYDDALFRSVVAHAIAEDNFQVVEPSRMAHEYIAYIVQMATLPPHLRYRIFDHHQVPAFDSEVEINPMVYGLNPDVFAVKSYLHYRRPTVGVAFLQTLLNRDLMSIFPLWENHAAQDPLVGGQTAGR
jgi:hypothetical protein